MTHYLTMVILCGGLGAATLFIVAAILLPVEPLETPEGWERVRSGPEEQNGLSGHGKPVIGGEVQ